MKFTVHRLFFVWDFEKEDQWLNEMAAKGMNLTSVGFCTYVFEEGTPGEYQYHLEWLKKFPGHAESVAYIRFLEGTGIEHIGSFKKKAYFRKKACDGAFDLFSDLDSRIELLTRFFPLMGLLLIILAAGVAQSIVAVARYEEAFSAMALMLCIYVLMFYCLLVGFIKTLRTFSKLKRERITRE